MKKVPEGEPDACRPGLFIISGALADFPDSRLQI